MGLILILLSTYLIIEWKSYELGEIYQTSVKITDLKEEAIPITIPPTPPPAPIPISEDVIKVIDNEDPEPEDAIPSKESRQETIIDIAEIEDVEPTEEIAVPFEFIEEVPVYPGCENLSNNEERKACLTEKFTQFINKRFNRDIGEWLGLTGVNHINFIFKINTHGNIVEVQSRAPHPKLREKAGKVINALPKMQPGKQRGKPVPVSYSLPIIFQVQN
jgi:protein TonB